MHWSSDNSVNKPCISGPSANCTLSGTMKIIAVESYNVEDYIALVDNTRETCTSGFCHCASVTSI